MSKAPKPQPAPEDASNAPGKHFSPADAPANAQLTVRRAPSLVAFAVTGLLVGLIVAFFVTAFGPEHQDYTFGAVYGVMAVIFGATGTALAIILALLLDRRSAKKTMVYRAVSTD